MGEIYEWNDLPASFHNDAANLTYGDGHAEAHRWATEATRRARHALMPDAAGLLLALAPGQRDDIYWLLKRTSDYESYQASR